MRDYRNEEGRTLFYEFAKRLRKTNIKRDVQDLISSSDWKSRFNKGSTEIGEKGEQTNEALNELEGLIRMYWDQVTEDILFENKNFLESFINAEENSLYNEIQIK